jgi:hypothetical protein
MEDLAIWTFSCLRMVDRCESFNVTRPAESRMMLCSEICKLVSYFFSGERHILDCILEDASTPAMKIQRAKQVYTKCLLYKTFFLHDIHILQKNYIKA